MNKIKGIRELGIYLIGYKHKKTIKPYHNLTFVFFISRWRTCFRINTVFWWASWIDDRTVTRRYCQHSCQGKPVIQICCSIFTKIRTRYWRSSSECTWPSYGHPTFCWWHCQFNLEHKTSIVPTNILCELVKTTKLLINNLIVKEFNFRDFENPSEILQLSASACA